MRLRSVMEAVGNPKCCVSAALMCRGMHGFQSLLWKAEQNTPTKPRTPHKSWMVFLQCHNSSAITLPSMTSTPPAELAWISGDRPFPEVSRNHATTPHWRDVKPGRRSVNKGRELQILSWPRRLERLKQRRLATNLTGSWFVGFFLLRWPCLPRLCRRPPVAWQLRSDLPGRSVLTYDLVPLMSTDDRPRENNWSHESGRGRYSFFGCFIISGMTWSHGRTQAQAHDYCF